MADRERILDIPFNKRKVDLNKSVITIHLNQNTIREVSHG